MLAYSNCGYPFCRYIPALGGRGASSHHSPFLWDCAGLLCEYRRGVVPALGKTVESSLHLLRGLSLLASRNRWEKEEQFIPLLVEAGQLEPRSCWMGPDTRVCFPTSQHCWTVFPRLHHQAMTVVQFVPLQRSAKIMTLEGHKSSQLNFLS